MLGIILKQIGKRLCLVLILGLHVRGKGSGTRHFKTGRCIVSGSREGLFEVPLMELADRQR
jgi:hypothetical protein